MADQDEVLTRDLATVNQTSPGLTQFETPSASSDGQAQAEAQRPVFSPVAQPGMNEEIWWHTVENGQQAQAAPPSRGMIARLNPASRVRVTVNERRRRRGRRAGRPERP